MKASVDDGIYDHETLFLCIVWEMLTPGNTPRPIANQHRRRWFRPTATQVHVARSYRKIKDLKRYWDREDPGYGHAILIQEPGVAKPDKIYHVRWGQKWIRVIRQPRVMEDKQEFFATLWNLYAPYAKRNRLRVFQYAADLEARELAEAKREADLKEKVGGLSYAEGLENHKAKSAEVRAHRDRCQTRPNSDHHSFNQWITVDHEQLRDDLNWEREITRQIEQQLHPGETYLDMICREIKDSR
jgi:hypothetical protein